MNGLLTLVIIVAVYLPVMVIFAALRAIQSDINVIYSRTYTAPSSLDLIESLVRRIDAKVERGKVTAIAEAYEQGKKDAHMWTPTAESRPPIDKPVLVCDFTGYRNSAILKKLNGAYMWQTAGGFRAYEDIAAWQKMPEPYTGENDETEHEAEENEK